MTQPLENDASSNFGSADDAEFGWVNYFLTLRGNEFFCEVEEDYMQDNFNLTGLVSEIPYYDFALDLICDIENDEEFSDEHLEMIENDAEVLYGLIHARYILTNRGLYAMMDKYRHNDFGSCPRVLCSRQSLLPVGLTETKGKEPVRLYCARCKDVYKCKSSRHDNIDGAYFGTTFPHLFYLVFPELQPKASKQSYLPRVFGFKLHPTSHERSLEATKKMKEVQYAKEKAKQKQKNDGNAYN